MSDDYERCGAEVPTRDGDSHACGKPATHSAYSPPIFFCSDCLHACMEDASPEEQATVRTSRLEERALGIEQAARIGRMSLEKATELEPRLDMLKPVFEPLLGELEALAKSIRKDL